MLASILTPLFAAAIPVEVLLAVGVVTVIGLIAGGIGLWRVFGSGPRRNRAYQRARELLAAGDAENARTAIEEIKLLGISTPEWQGRLNNLEGECRRASGEAALSSRKFEEALEHHLAAAKLLSTNPTEARERVIEGMLAELRQRAAGAPDDKLTKLAQRILQLAPQHPETSFWLGLANIKLNRVEPALTALRAAFEADKKSVEPALYLGMLLTREGKAKDALRYLSEANKNAPHSALINWQLGMGLVMAGSDPALAVRALQKAVAADGLAKLAKDPGRFWTDALPDGSYIGKLATKQPFACPLIGNNFIGMARQAKLAFGQALYRIERITESIHVFQDLLNEGEPTPAVSRALGIALCRVDRFDDAYAHLRSAFEQDAAKNPITACYLALCATKARPAKPEDTPANVRWALRLLSDVSIPAEQEPVRLAAQVYAEAKRIGVPVPVDDLAKLSGAIAALGLTEPFAAAIIDQLAANAMPAVRPPLAFLYGWAASQHRFRGEKDNELHLLLFQNEVSAREYYSQRGWRLEDVEWTFLERWAESHTSFPADLGPDFAVRAERSLLDRAKSLEQAGDVAGARAAVEVLRRLLPPTATTFDQTARLAFARRDFDESRRVLTEWCSRFPNEAAPLLRLAALEQSCGNSSAAREHVTRALEIATPVQQPIAAMAGVRLALAAGQREVALENVERVLGSNAGNAEALCLKAAILWQLGRHDQLRALAASFERIDVADPKFHYMAAVCFALNDDFDAARTAARRVSNEPGWQIDGHHLMGVLYWRRADYPGAAARLEAVLASPDYRALAHARLTLGRVRWEQGSVVEAATLWSKLSNDERKAMHLDEALPVSAFLAGIECLRKENPAAAADWLNQAREMGFRDRHLPVLHERALVEAARQSLVRSANGDLDALTPLLDRASKSRSPQQAVAALVIARIHRRKCRLAEARDALRRVSPPSPGVMLQMAAIALQDQQLGQAEELLGRVLHADPGNAAARFNLIWTRLSLGNVSGALELLPPLLSTAPQEWQRTLTQLHTLLQGGSTLNIAFADMTQEEERRLLESLLNVGKLEAVVPLLCQFAAARPQSREAREAQTLGMLRLGKQSFDRGDWISAERWLAPLAKARPSAVVRNLLGLNACLTQDFAGGILHLQEAQRLAGDDPRLHQNLALAFALQGDFDEAGLCWGRYLGMMDKRLPRPPGYIDYHEKLRYQVLRFLGNQQYDRERWPEALSFLEEAHSFQPELTDLAERVFLLQIQVGKRTEARRTLNHLHQLKPKHSTYQLYELDLVDVRASADLEKLLDALSRVVEQMMDDPSVQDKAVQRVMPALQHRADYLTRVMREIREDLRKLYEDSPGWYDALRDLRSVKRDLRRLRQVVRYCAALQVVDATRRKLDTLTEDLDRKIEYCRRWEEEDQ
jgi:tetratricopeptide (TPR) repeat protein